MTDRLPPTRRPRWRCALLAAATGLAACSGDTTRVYDVRINSTYEPAGLRTSGTFPLVVLGTPPDGSSAEEVAAAMRLSEHMGGATMTVAPPGTQGRRFVMAFVAGSPDWACKWTGVTEGESPTDRLEATFAWCQGAAAMSGGQLISGATRGPRDEGFEPAIRQLYGATLPVRSPNKSTPAR